MDLGKEKNEKINEILDILSEEQPELQEFYDKVEAVFNSLDAKEQLKYVFGMVTATQYRVNKLEQLLLQLQTWLQKVSSTTTNQKNA